MTTVRSPGAAAAAADYHYYNVSAFVTGLIGDTSREAALSYPELLRTEEQEQALSEILGILSANYLVKILPNIPNLERAGTRIDGLHPFRSFGFFLSNIERREKLKIVLNYHTPWPIAFVKDKFLEGFSTALEHRAKNILLLKFLDGFADEILLDSEKNRKEALIPELEKKILEKRDDFAVKWQEFIDILRKFTLDN